MVYVKGIVLREKWKQVFRIASEMGLGSLGNKALNRVPSEFLEGGTPHIRRATLQELLGLCMEEGKIDELLYKSKGAGCELIRDKDYEVPTFSFMRHTYSFGSNKQLSMSIDLEIVQIAPRVSVTRYPLTFAQVYELTRVLPGLYGSAPDALKDKLKKEVGIGNDDLPLTGMDRRFMYGICDALRSRFLSYDEWMFAAGVQNVDSLNNLLGSKSLREGSFPVGMPDGLVSPWGVFDMYDNGVEVVSGMDRTLRGMGVVWGKKEEIELNCFNGERMIVDDPEAPVTKDSFPLSQVCLRLAFSTLGESTVASEIISSYTRRGEPFGIGWGVPLWLFLRDKYISGLKNLSKNIRKAGVGDKVVNFKPGEACVIVQWNKEKREFVISSGLRNLFSIRGIREIQIKKDVSSDELFSVLRIAMRMRKEDLLRGFIKTYHTSVIPRYKKTYISVVLSEKERGNFTLIIKKLHDLNGG